MPRVIVVIVMLQLHTAIKPGALLPGNNSMKLPFRWYLSL